jgi:hypothetical protein
VIDWNNCSHRYPGRRTWTFAYNVYSLQLNQKTGVYDFVLDVLSFSVFR